MMNKFIYGKSPISKIVSIEVEDDKTTIRRLLDDSTYETVVNPNKFWILSNKQVDSDWVRLKGDLHYKYGKQFTERTEYDRVRINLRKKCDIYSIYNSKESSMVKDGYSYYKDLRVQDVPTLSFDIESAGLLSDPERKVFIIANLYRDRNKTVEKSFCLDDYGDNEQLMIKEWCDWVRDINPSIMVGHNVFGYDLPYLEDCARKYGDSLALGTDGSDIKFNHYESDYRVDGNNKWTYRDCNIYGREIVDTAFVAVKFDFAKNFPSWGLKPIAKYLEVASEDRQYYDASKIKTLWYDEEERKLIKEYALDDVRETLAIYDKMIPAYFYIAQYLPKPFQKIINSATGSWINSFLVRAYIQDRHSIPKPNLKSDSEDVNGGMSYGVPGVYKNVTKWDADSYYPSTILAFNIYPEEKDPNKYFLAMVDYFTKKRFEEKKLYKETGDDIYDNLQAASKIFINSSYGALATSGLNFNDFSKAALITRCCRAGLQKCVVWATGRTTDYWWSDYKMEKTSSDDFTSSEFIDSKAKVPFSSMQRHRWNLVNLDTDSLSFCKPDNSEFTNDELETIHNEINDIMYSGWSDDGLYESVVILKAKNYALLPKGKDKVKFKGSSITDSKKEPALQELLKDSIRALIYGDRSVVDLYEEKAKEVCRIDDIARWCVKKSITKAVLTNDRANEANVRDAFNGRVFSEGEKIFTFYSGDFNNKQLILREDYSGSYCVRHYLKRIYNTMEILSNVIDMSTIPKYYTVKLSKQLLDRDLVQQ